MNDLQYAATPLIGVLYPLQTFSKQKKVDFKSIPVFIESLNEETDEILRLLANAISPQVRKITSAERKAMHVAAVFASNFTNHMLTISKGIMKGYSLEYGRGSWIHDKLQVVIFSWGTSKLCKVNFDECAA